MARLQNKTAVITGGSTGIGFATAQQFITEGARVIITGRNEERLAAAIAQLGSQASYIKSDSSVIAELDHLAAEVSRQVGHFDILFVNAGVAMAAPFREVTESTFDQEMSINMKGVFFTIQKLEALMNEGGSIITNTTTLAQTAMLGESVYSASKAAVRSLTRSLALELRDRRIRVNAVAPGPIETPIWSKMEVTNETAQAVLARTPIGRFGKPEEVAKAVTFLASDDSSYMLGEEILVDGGWSTL